MSYGLDGYTTLSPGNVAEDGLEALTVLGSGRQACTASGGDGERQGGFAAEHVLQLGGLVHDLVQCHAHEVHEHQVHDGP